MRLVSSKMPSNTFVSHSCRLSDLLYCTHPRGKVSSQLCCTMFVKELLKAPLEVTSACGDHVPSTVHEALDASSIKGCYELLSPLGSDKLVFVP